MVKTKTSDLVKAYRPGGEEDALVLTIPKEIRQKFDLHQGDKFLSKFPEDGDKVQIIYVLERRVEEGEK